MAAPPAADGSKTPHTTTRSTTSDAAVAALLAGPFPHQGGDSINAHIHHLPHPHGAGAGALVIDLRGDALAWSDDDAADNADDDFTEVARTEGAFSAVALPATVPWRLWTCEHADDGVPGIAWQAIDLFTGQPQGRLTIALLPDAYDASSYDEWLHVDEDWLECLFPALFAPEPDLYYSADSDPRTARTSEEMASALSWLEQAADLFAVDQDAWPLGEALALLAWMGAGQPGPRTTALAERHGVAAGRYAFEWHRRGYTEDDRLHFTEWLTPEDELLLWRRQGGARMEALTRWLDGAEPVLHGMDSAVLVHTVLASCRWDTEQMWTPEEIRRTYDRGLTNPHWWSIFGESYVHEDNPAEREGSAGTIIDYVLRWADAMPLDAAIWYLAHQTPFPAAARSYAAGEFNREGFLTVWALDPIDEWNLRAMQRELAQEPGWDIGHGLLVPAARPELQLAG